MIQDFLALEQASQINSPPNTSNNPQIADKSKFPTSPEVTGRVSGTTMNGSISNTLKMLWCLVEPAE